MLYNFSLFAIWLLFVGTFDISSVIKGILLVVFTRFIVRGLARAMYLDDKISAFNYKILFYIPWLMREVWKSTISVLKVVWSPNMNMSSEFQTIKTQIATDAGKVLYANSMTLTPGTYAVNIEEDEILIHALVKQDIWPDAMEKKISEVVKCST